MVKLTEREKILCVLGFGEGKRIKEEIVEFFNATNPDRQPISQSMVSRVVHKYCKFGYVRGLNFVGSRRQKTIRLMLCCQWKKIIT